VDNYTRNPDGTKGRFDIEKDAFGAIYIPMEIDERSVYFLENAIFTMEV